MAAVAKIARRYAANDESPMARASPSLLSEAPSDPKELKSTDEQRREWNTLYQHFESRLQALITWRLPWWTTAGQIARYMAPHRYYHWIVGDTYTQGYRKDQAIVDRTATLCGEVCAAGLMAGLTDPDRDWARFGPAIPNFELDQNGQSWYEDIGERYNYILTHSNFYDAQAQHYSDLVFFGTAVAIDHEDADEIIRVASPCSGEYSLGVGFDNSDEVFYEEFRYTVNQIVEAFQVENCPEDVLKLWRQKGGALQKEFVVGHAIEPNFAIDDGKGGSVGQVPGGFTWREVYWLRGKKDQKPLSIAGFHEQPHGVSRWNTQGNEAYGRGVGENMLGDCIQLQAETRAYHTALLKVNDPPMGADVTLQNLSSSTNPGKVTYFNTMNGKPQFFPLYQINPQLEAMSKNLDQVRERLARTAYNQVFQPVGNLREETRGQVTATEIDAIKEEQLMQLGPVIGRVYNTMRQRTKRHLAIMQRRGLIPPKPPSLRGVPTKIEFISMLTAAQKATQTAALARTFQFAGSISGVYPESRFALDPLEGIREFNDGVGGSSKYVRSASKVKQLIQMEAKKAAASQAMEQSLPGARAAEALSKTSLAPGTALSALAGQGGPQ